MNNFLEQLNSINIGVFYDGRMGTFVLLPKRARKLNRTKCTIFSFIPHDAQAHYSCSVTRALLFRFLIDYKWLEARIA